MSAFHPNFSSFPDLEENNVDKKERSSKEHKSRKEKEKHSRNKDTEDERDRRDSSDRQYRSRHGESKHEHSSRRRRSRSRSPERKKSKHSSHKHKVDHSWSLLEDDKRRKAREDQALLLAGDVEMQSSSSKGGLHQGDIPRFYRDGKGRVLGLTSAWRISRGSGNKDVEVNRRDKHKAPRYTDFKSLKALVEGPHRLLLPAKTSLTTYGEFIPLGKSTRSEDIHPEDSYRSIVPEPPPDSDPELEQESGRSDTNSGDEFEGTTLPAEQEKMKSLEETVRRAPQDEQSWLHLLSVSIDSISNRTKRGVKAKAEIATSILKRALDAHRDNEASPRLRLLYIMYGEEIWDEEKTRRSWNSLLSDFGGNDVPPWKQALIWMTFLDWSIINRPSISEALDDARRALAQLQGSEFEMARVRILWRIAVFLREAGFLEQAMAIFQAQMELALFGPPELISHPLEDRVNSLEEFWEAEVPRIPETGARGWAQWVESGQPEAQVLHRQPSRKTEAQDPYQQWSCQEKSLDIVGAFPTRSFTEDESDPYSTILFSDIRDFLSDLRSNDVREYLAMAFLSFIGLNIPGIGERGPFLGSNGQCDIVEDGWMVSGQRGWPSRPEDLFPSQTEQKRITWESHVGVIVAAEQPRRSGFGPVKEWGMHRSFFEGIDSFCTGRTWEAADIYCVDIGIVRNAMNQLASVIPSLNWEDMKAALDAAVDVKAAVKGSKQRLESRQSDVNLWRTHIKLESIKGETGKVAKMYSTLLAAQSSDPNQLLLYSDAIEYRWLQESEQMAIQLLKSALGIDQESKGAMYLLRGRNSLSSLLSIEREWSIRRVAIVRLQFFFHLDTGTLENAISAFMEVADTQNIPKDTRESLYTWISVTVFRLSQRRGIIVPPPVLSTLVTKALQLFPNNTVLLGLFLECERGQGIWGRIRRFLTEETNGTIVSQRIKRIAWNLWAEGWNYGPWEPERVRSQLEGALNLRSNKRSVVLWQVYVALEMRVGNFERAKRVLLRALGVCWWAKELYLIAFGQLRTVFTARELNDMIAAMVDRGIRMRRDIQEQLEGWIDPSTAIEEDEHNAGDMEVERMLHGREQAKPY